MIDLSTAVWLLIGLAVVTAGLPFWLQQTLVVLPWSAGVARQPVWLRWLLCIGQGVLLWAWGWLTFFWVGQTLAGSGVALLVRVLALLLVAGLLLWWPTRLPGAATVDAAQPKLFVSRFIETLVLFAMLGALSFALEAQFGSVFPQGWEFYAITLSLYLVMAYPGFVFRYLLRRNRPVTPRAVSGKPV